ncbi:hypothetical protein F0562_025001 [Nyssa sinensis]|uniref:Uncharacterized protein n=1 Tax=Nyssa sinensis TaxID=561372 RepID=A0A5J5BEK4_9ASTE|nr:hypothetical protein F0562_025001 [Nyssa sinensis]
MLEAFSVGNKKLANKNSSDHVGAEEGNIAIERVTPTPIQKSFRIGLGGCSNAECTNDLQHPCSPVTASLIQRLTYAKEDPTEDIHLNTPLLNYHTGKPFSIENLLGFGLGDETAGKYILGHRQWLSLVKPGVFLGRM